MTKKWICRERTITIVMIIPGYARGLESGISVTSVEDKDQSLVSFSLQRKVRVNMRRTRLFGYSPVQVDRLVSYPLVFIHLRNEYKNE